MKNIIEIKNLSKSFGEIKAVENLSFPVKEGDLFAFLGTNGAGKSTTINIICATLSKDEGQVIIDGVDIDENVNLVKSKIGVVFQNSVLDSNLSVYDNLESRAALYGIVGDSFKKRLFEISELLNLKDLLKRTVGRLSGGQRRRIDIARALIHDPKILILDEPTTGLDPQTRRDIWDVISRERKTKNTTVFLTTHYMEEAAEADCVVVIDSGKIAAMGSPLELKGRYAKDYITLYGITEEDARKIGFPYERIKDAYRLTIPNTSVATELILKNPELFCNYEITKGKMDDVFLAITGKSLTEDENK